MLRIQDLSNYVNSLVPFRYYAYSFPTTSTTPDECAVISIVGGMPMDADTGVARPGIQVLVRGKPYDLKNAEDKAYAIFGALANKREVTLGAASVVQIQATQSAPFYIGMDEANRPIYSMNFLAVVRP